MGSSFEAPSRAAVVSEEVGGGGSDAGPVFKPAAELALARNKNDRRWVDLDCKRLDSVPLLVIMF